MTSGMVEVPLKPGDVHELLRVEDQLRVDDDLLKPMLPGRRSNRNRVIYNASSVPGRQLNRKYSDDLAQRNTTSGAADLSRSENKDCMCKLSKTAQQNIMNNLLQLMKP